MLARPVANGGQKNRNKNKVIGTQRAIHLPFSPAVKSKHAGTRRATERPALAPVAKHAKQR